MSTIEYAVNKYDVRLEFISPIHGGTPKNADVAETWINTNLGRAEIEGQEKTRKLKVTMDELKETLVEMETNISNGFRVSEGRIYAATYQIKAMLKEAAESLRRAGVLKVTSYRQRLGRDVQVFGVEEPFKIFFKRNGSILKTADGNELATVHAMTPTGPINAIKKSDVVNPPAEIEFTIEVVGKSITEDQLKLFLTHAGRFIGFGSDRGLQNGLFNVAGFKSNGGENE